MIRLRKKKVFWLNKDSRRDKKKIFHNIDSHVPRSLLVQKLIKFSSEYQTFEKNFLFLGTNLKIVYHD